MRSNGGGVGCWPKCEKGGISEILQKSGRSYLYAPLQKYIIYCIVHNLEQSQSFADMFIIFFVTKVKVIISAISVVPISDVQGLLGSPITSPQAGNKDEELGLRGTSSLLVSKTIQFLNMFRVNCHETPSFIIEIKNNRTSHVRIYWML